MPLNHPQSSSSSSQLPSPSAPACPPQHDTIESTERLIGEYYSDARAKTAADNGEHIDERNVQLTRKDANKDTWEYTVEVMTEYGLYRKVVECTRKGLQAISPGIEGSIVEFGGSISEVSSSGNEHYDSAVEYIDVDSNSTNSISNAHVRDGRRLEEPPELRHCPVGSPEWKRLHFYRVDAETGAQYKETGGFPFPPMRPVLRRYPAFDKQAILPRPLPSQSKAASGPQPFELNVSLRRRRYAMNMVEDVVQSNFNRAHESLGVIRQDAVDALTIKRYDASCEVHR